MYVYLYRFQNVFLRCPTPRLHCFLSCHWPSFRFLSFMASFIPSIQFFFGLSRALFCFGIHSSAVLDNLPSAILWTWPYHVSWFCSISFIIVSSSPDCSYIPSIQFFFGLPRALFCFGIHFSAVLDNLPSAILWTWPYYVSWFCSISFIIVSSSPICCLIVYISNSLFSWYSRWSSQGIHLCSFHPSFIIFYESPCFGTI